MKWSLIISFQTPLVELTGSHGTQKTVLSLQKKSRVSKHPSLVQVVEGPPSVHSNLFISFVMVWTCGTCTLLDPVAPLYR